MIAFSPSTAGLLNPTRSDTVIITENVTVLSNENKADTVTSQCTTSQTTTSKDTKFKTCPHCHHRLHQKSFARHIKNIHVAVLTNNENKGDSVMSQSSLTSTISQNSTSKSTKSFVQPIKNIHVSGITNNKNKCGTLTYTTCPQCQLRLHSKSVARHVKKIHGIVKAKKDKLNLTEFSVSKKIAKCPHCQKEISKKNFVRHISQVHFMEYNNLVENSSVEIDSLSSQFDSHLIQCPKCPAQMRNIFYLKAHLKMKHDQVSSQNISKDHHDYRCHKCKDFSTKFLHVLRSHCERVHSVQINIQHNSFTSETEFAVWKEDIEKKTNSMFVKPCGSTSRAGITTTHFVCNRSGFTRTGSSGMRSLKGQASCKISGRCSAFMTTKKNHETGKIYVNYCLDHIGHEMEFEHLRLSKRVQQAKAGKVASGVDLNAVMDSVRDDKSTTLDRDVLLTRRYLHNIKKTIVPFLKYKRPKKRSASHTDYG